MPKPSTYLAKLQMERNNRQVQIFTRQMTVDLTLLVLNEQFGLGAQRLKKFCDALTEKYTEFSDLWNGDTKDVEYSKDVLDRALKNICGEYFVPWDLRYGGIKYGRK